MKKGISILSLTVAIIVMLILTGIVTISMTNTLNYTNINTFALELINIQTAVDDYYYKNGEYPTGNAITVSTSKIEAASMEQFD